MRYTPSKQLAAILRPAYAPCAGFGGVCKVAAKWDPGNGLAPRGFLGATSKLDEVEVVILVAEPGNPYDGRGTFSLTQGQQGLLRQACHHTLEHLRDGTDLFHRNLRLLLDLIFPDLPFEEQLKRAWLTETYLCSAPEEGGNVPAEAERECATRYLQKQLTLLQGRPVIALGGKAQKRARRYAPNLIKAYSIAPPGCNHRPARPSWESAAKQARAIIRRRRAA